MEKFVVDKIIAEQFEYYQNMCSLLSEFKDSTFAPSAMFEKIEKWEKRKWYYTTTSVYELSYANRMFKNYGGLHRI